MQIESDEVEAQRCACVEFMYDIFIVISLTDIENTILYLNNNIVLNIFPIVNI